MLEINSGSCSQVLFRNIYILFLIVDENGVVELFAISRTFEVSPVPFGSTLLKEICLLGVYGVNE